jgi:acyl-CoA thioesterase-1
VRRLLLVLLLGALLTSAGCSSSPSGAATGPTATGPTATAAPGTSASAQDPTVVFLGDSYTVGVGGTGYVSRTAAELGWVAYAQGESGTGYRNPSTVPGQTVFGDRLAGVVAADPDVVVVQGSTNDVGQRPELVQAAAATLYAALHASLPSARLVVLGPLSPPDVDAGAVLALRNALVAAASAAGLPYIDPVAGGWLSPPDGLFADGIHPNDAGYAQLSDDLAAALHRLGY